MISFAYLFCSFNGATVITDPFLTEKQVYAPARSLNN
jgi:hypothetical protein